MTVLIIMAHPDDAEVAAGGTAVEFARAGHTVVCVSATNGGTGHHEMGGVELARRRYREAQAASEIGGFAEYRVLDNHNGELEPSVAYRKQIIRIIREYDPDLILTHRPWDYHPDHRAIGTLVQDASYIVTVPNMQPLSDIPSKPIRIYFAYDRFQKPYPFQPDVVIPIDDVFDEKLAMLACHESQMFEWIPFNRGVLDTVPAGRAERLEWLRKQRAPYFSDIADAFRSRLAEQSGDTVAAGTRYAEAFEACEYGAPPSEEERRTLFPMIP